MKKILLLLFVPICLSAQFEDDYYILTNDIKFFSIYSLFEYNLENNTIVNTFDDLNYDDGNGNIYPQMNCQLLTYIPNSPYLLVENVEHFIRPAGGEYGHGNYISYYNDFEMTGQFFTEAGGGAENNAGYGGSYNIGMAGIIDNEMKVVTLQHSYGTIPSNVNLVIYSEESAVGLDISAYVEHTDTWPNFYNPSPGLAYSPENNSLYFIGVGMGNLPVFYKVDLQNNQITELPTDFGSTPCCKFYAMHFMRGQNKILMVNHDSGDFYTYDLNTNLVELYAQTDLQHVSGIVNKHDFLGNIEVYNQGEIEIYPNPVERYLNIKTNSPIEKIELFNILGQRIRDFDSNSKTLNLESEAKGVYVLKLQMENGKIETKKIIKK